MQHHALIAGMFAAAGAEGVDMPDWTKARADFDAELVAEPKPVSRVDSDRHVLLTALGLR